jgi:hypothetical protein
VDADWRRVQLTNWGQFLGCEDGLTVRKNSNSLEVFCDVVEGKDPDELLLLAKAQADRVAKALETRLKMRLGEGKLSRKPHFGVYDPVAALVSKHWELSDDIGKIDESEGHGEIDWFGPETAKQYLLMPRTISQILQALQTCAVNLQTFAVGMKEHMALVRDLRELIKVLQAAVEKLR